MDEQKIQQLIEEALKKAFAKQPVQRATVDAKDAAAYIGVCLDTLMAEVRRGNVPFIKLRGRYVFRLQALDDWMDEQERNGLRNVSGH